MADSAVMPTCSVLLRAILGLAMLFTVAYVEAGCQGPENRITVRNHSGQTILIVTVTLRSGEARFTDILSGRSASEKFTITGDDHFGIEGQLADGTKFSGDYGYVTNGMVAERAVFTVKQSGVVEFEQCRIGDVVRSQNC